MDRDCVLLAHFRRVEWKLVYTPTCGFRYVVSYSDDIPDENHWADVVIFSLDERDDAYDMYRKFVLKYEL